MSSLVSEDLGLLKRFAAISRAISASVGVDESLGLIAGSAVELVEGAASLVLLKDRDDCLRIRAVRGIDASLAEGFSGPMEEAVVGDLRRYLRLPDSRILAAVPILSARTVQGLVVVVRDAPLDPQETCLLSALADQAAITLANLRLHEQLLSRETQLQEEGARSRKLVLELETLLQTVAHDLRWPLRSMTSCGDLLLHEYGEFLTGRGREYLVRIASGALKMDVLIQDLLRYSDLARSELLLEPVDLRDAVFSALVELADRGRVRIASPLPVVVANREVLVTMLRNLLSNALKFVRPGEVPSVTVESERRGELVRLFVADCGIGISDQGMDRMFGVFERLNRAEEFPGTGIGLAIVRSGAERMGGSCGVESKLGVGSRFWIDLRAE